MAGGGPGDRPNLLLITTDQQRWDSLACLSPAHAFMHTPHIEALATRGTVFERCYTTAPLCVPMRASMMSGMYASTTGIMGNNHWLSPETPVWSSAATAQGYATSAIGKMHFAPWDNLGGFAERIIAEDKRHVYLPDDHAAFLAEHGYERAHPTANPGYFENLGASVTPLPKRFHIDGYVGDQATEWLSRHSAEGSKPFATWVSFAGPHDPYDPPEEMAQMYRNAPIPPVVGSAAELSSKPKAQRSRNRGSRSSSMYRYDPGVRPSPTHASVVREN